MGQHEIRVVYRDTDDEGTLKMKVLRIGIDPGSVIKHQYPIVLLGVARENPAGNPIVEEVSGHDVYTCYEVKVGSATHGCIQGATLTGSTRGVSRRIYPAVGPFKVEPVEKDLAAAVACCGDVVWPSAQGISGAELDEARVLAGIPTAG
jgi:hypothetical protein